MYIDRIKKNIKDVAELISQLEGKKTNQEKIMPNMPKEGTV